MLRSLDGKACLGEFCLRGFGHDWICFFTIDGASNGRARDDAWSVSL